MVVIALIFSTVAMTVSLMSLINKTTNTSAPVQYTMAEDDKEEFLKADQESAQQFYSALSKLNAFMTDSEEDNTNVGQQEKV